nr:F-box domain, leucine-rich repeat domain, L domain-like protein [Tanacetum cinerariifolium]
MFAAMVGLMTFVNALLMLHCICLPFVMRLKETRGLAGHHDIMFSAAMSLFGLVEVRLGKQTHVSGRQAALLMPLCVLYMPPIPSEHRCCMRKYALFGYQFPTLMAGTDSDLGTAARQRVCSYARILLTTGVHAQHNYCNGFDHSWRVMTGESDPYLGMAASTKKVKERPRKGENRFKTGQKREAWRSREKFKAVIVDREGKTEQNAKRMAKNANTRQTSSTQEYPSLVDTFFVAHTVNEEFLRDEDRRIYEEMRRLEATGTYTDDEINSLARGGKQRGHITGVGRVLPARATASPSTLAHESTLNSLHKKVDFMMSLFKSDSKCSDMFSQFESGGASRSGVCGDEEEGADHHDDEDEDGDGDT